MLDAAGISEYDWLNKFGQGAVPVGPRGVHTASLFSRLRRSGVSGAVRGGP